MSPAVVESAVMVPVPAVSMAAPAPPILPVASRLIVPELVMVPPPSTMLLAPPPVVPMSTLPAPAFMADPMVTFPVFWMSTAPPPVVMDPLVLSKLIPVVVKLPPFVVILLFTSTWPDPLAVS